MHAAFLNLKKYLLFTAVLFCFYTANAQVKYNDIVMRIDSFANVGLPKSAMKEVEKLDSIARKNNDPAQQIRAVVYHMTFQSYIEENALLAIISRLKRDIDRAQYPVKPVLQSLLAQMYWNYYQENRYGFSQRTRQLVPDSDFTRWDLRTIIDQTSHLYETSIHDITREQNTPVSVLNGALDGDSTNRHLRPTLYDLLVQRAFDFFLADESSLPQPKLPFSLNDPAFFCDSRVFVNLPIKTTDTASVEYKGIRYLQQATQFHLQHGDQEALADLDMQRLRFLYGRSNIEHKDSLYLAALDQVYKHVSSKPISSDVLVLEGQYYQQADSLVTAHALFENAAAVWPKSQGGKNAAILLRQMEEKALKATVEDVNIPGRPVLALLNYKNLRSAKLAIFKLSEKQFAQYRQDNGRYDASEFFKKYAPVQTNVLNWDTVKDYESHTVEFKIDPLKPGNYVLMMTGPWRSDSLTEVTDFKISRLVDINRLDPNGAVELLVTDRETGEPLTGVKVTLKGRDTTEKGETDADGKFKPKGISRSDVDVTLSLKGDTLSRSSLYLHGAEDGSDDKLQTKTVLFTDRQIYRPGQTIYFKALHLQNVKGDNKILPHTEVDFELMDANYKSAGTLDLKTNDFGTVAGSFLIPQTALGGHFTLKTADGSVYIRVEEYKRPSFQVEFSPIKEGYKLNDPIKVAGLVTAFSGYGLSQARVACHIIRSRRVLYNRRKSRLGAYHNYNNADDEIKTDTLLTDNQGRFNVRFKATIADADKWNDVTYNYKITADVTDEIGETQSGNTNVVVGSNDLKIDGDFPGMVFAKDSVQALLRLLNLNNQPQSGTIKVEVFALKEPGQVFKTRVWPLPEQINENAEDFKNDFPDYAYKNEDQPATWPVAKQVLSVGIKADTMQATVVDLTALGGQPSGLYRAVLSARNAKGDTVSRTTYIKVVNGLPKPSSMQDWEMAKSMLVNAGDSVLFFFGINHKVNILMERYNGQHLLFSKWMKIDTGMRQVKIASADTDRDAAVQFTMVYQNRVYSSYQKIYLSRPDKTLQLKFITFRDKLQPGQKEEWKLQIRAPGNKIPDAEMLAAMYDASLDKISSPQTWQQYLDENYHYTPNYFVWDTWDFVQPNETTDVDYAYRDYGLLTRDYERLNLLGYAYYGGYNSNYYGYLQMIAENARENTGKPVGKGGREIKGMVLAMDDGLPIPGVSVKIKGTGRGVQTRTNGRFTIFVPEKGILVFSFVGYMQKEISRFGKGDLIIKLTPDSKQLGEVVVTGALGIRTNARAMGFATQYKRDLSGAVASVSVADAKSLPTFKSDQLLTGQAAGVNVVNSGAPGAATRIVLRGNRSVDDETKPITPRTNFAETAFFYPQLHTDDKGEILIDFTIPESLTRWKFRAFAHTRELETGYAEAEIVTQKQLSISANAPRFLRDGDTITLSARLTNLTAGKLKGKVQLQLFNAVNMQPVNLFLNKTDAEQDFEVDGNTNKSVSFRLAIPPALDALDYKLTADAGEFTDGEENTLPVLPNRTLVTESMPMMVRAGQTKDFVFDKFVNQKSSTLKNKTLTLEYTSNPAWYVVQALPYMMEFPYECSEQVFSRYFANSLATDIVNKNPVIKKVFDQWKSTNSTELLSNLEKNQELKSTLIEETPWLRDATSESEQKKRIALLFDLNKMSDELKSALDKLQKRQLPDGSFTWFGGDRGDRYITQHIAEGMGELHHLHIGDDLPDLQQIAGKAIDYLDGELLHDEKLRKKDKDNQWYYGDIEIHAWFSRSYFLDKPMSKELKAALANYLKWAGEQWTSRNAYEQGMIALTMQRYKKADITAQIERSLMETAQQSDELGMYWAKNQLGYYWYESPIETQSLLIELFTEAGDNAKAVDEMKIWLLRNKQTNSWQTTKATAAACYALLLKGSNLLADTGITSIKLNGKPLNELKPDIKADAGTGYLKTSWVDEQVKPALGKVEIKNNGTIVSWGALHWQYLENLDKITSSNTNIHLQRKYFIQTQTDGGPVLTAVDATHQPKTGDLLKVVVYLTADRDFEYVQLKDMRPAGTEPVDALSTYKYQDGLYYYKVTKDVATNFFISELYKGSYVFEYRLRVDQPGNFSTGITSIQCMYAPEFNAHSEGGRMVVRP